MRPFTVLLTVLTMMLGGSPSARADHATIAVAANFRPVAEQLLPIIEADTGHRYTLVNGSTGKLAAQILSGAPYDVLMAADRARPQALLAQGLAAPADFAVYAVGQLALWAPDRQQSPDLGTLLAPWPSRLVIANPRLAPYGAAAQTVLASRGLWSQRRAQIVLADNAAAAYALVESGSVSMGLVAVATLLAAEVPTREFFRIESGQYGAIDQAMLLLNRGQDNAAARDWFEWLRSERMRTMLPSFGYELPELERGP